MAVVNDLLPHRKILPAGNQFLTYSNDGVRVITLTGMAQQVYSQSRGYLLFRRAFSGLHDMDEHRSGNQQKLRNLCY